ncbi:MAG: hypothetical protein U0166_10605 [Acidobacteriota bacterium]
MSHPRPAATLIALLVATSGWAGELTKAYFSATTAGTWARYQMKTEGVGTATYTYHRLADDGGRMKMVLDVVFVTGASEGSWSKSTYVLSKKFDVARDFMDYGQFTEELVLEAPGSGKLVQDAGTIKLIREGGYTFKNTMTFKGSEKVDGHDCDRYAYATRSGGPNPTFETGELWLDPSVPFGIVKQVATGKNDAGTFNARYEMRLLGSGTGEPPAEKTIPATAKGKVGAPAQGGSPAGGLAEAFKKGSVAISVTVADGSGGRRVSVTLTNQTDAPLSIELAEGETTVPAGLLLGELTLISGARRTIAIPARGTSEPVELEQGGPKGATNGSFEIVRDGDSVVFRGKASIGKLAE